GKREAQDCFVKVTQELVKILQQRTGDGYVFRTDLRLRPDAGATAVALSVDAAELYYQSMGLNWERAAMIKARVHAGDLEAGQAFLRDLRPFVWRKHLDFAALEDIHSMKARIHSHHKHKALQLPGQDIKLGPGGIREIEFFAQAHQMIAGGREPELRAPRTLEALSQLVELERIKPEDRDELEAAYRYLRALEHRLQMIRDEQTQILPETQEGLTAIATFMGEADLETFEARLMGHLKAVQTHYDELFRDPYAEDEEADDLSTLFTSEVIDEKALDKIRAFGFEDPERAAAIIRAWESGRYRACRTDRARKLLKELTPAILTSLGQTAGPDRALVRFDEFLGKLPSGVQLFSLFQANPNLLDLLADILGSAPALADFLGRNHLLLDAVLSPDFFDPMPGLDELKEELEEAMAPARDFQDILDLSRRWTNDRKFQIGVLTMRNVIDVNQAEADSSDVAEAVVDRLLPHVEREFAKQHGRVPGGGIILVAMGSFGGRSISFSSDLDMIFLYTAPDSGVESDGDRPLAASQYYMR
ncbi:MAG: glutamine-synthetase adenylyltransferase, partial [Alphaproteobacteria bacterium]|nr:glutamine-synthetase adenylyltransferase [Alphaproteobacteria bacterium]